MIFGNRKGDERILSFYWFIIFGIVAIVIVSGVLLVQKDLDVRDVESRILTNKIIDCVSENGVFQDGVISEIKGKGLGNCKINLEDGSYGDEEQFFVYFSVDGNEEFSFGNDMRAFCGKGGSGKENVPYCFEKKFVLQDSEGNLKLIEIVTIVRKIEQNVLR